MEARSIQRALVCYQKCLAAKKSKSIQVINFVPEHTVQVSKVDNCEATTMTGKKCMFKALCGTKYCKRHQIIL